MTLDGERCVSCEKAKFKLTPGVESCALCEDLLKGAITEAEGSTTNSSCLCPAGTYDNLKEEDRRCEVVDEGVSEFVEGMTLESLSLEAGFWRTNTLSLDVRQCPVELACAGGNGTRGRNGTGYCLHGHEGAYCSLCSEGLTVDAFGICQKCKANVWATTITILVVSLLLTGVIMLCRKKKLAEQKKTGNEAGRKPSAFKRLKNSGKIILVGWQIICQLPAVIPTMPLPSNVKEAVYASQVLNLNPFQGLNALCLSNGINYYHQLVGLTFPIIVICLILFVLGHVRKERGSSFFNAAIAILYLTLPTVSTTIFR